MCFDSNLAYSFYKLKKALCLFQSRINGTGMKGLLHCSSPTMSSYFKLEMSCQLWIIHLTTIHFSLKLGKIFIHFIPLELNGKNGTRMSALTMELEQGGDTFCIKKLALLSPKLKNKPTNTSEAR